MQQDFHPVEFDFNFVVLVSALARNQHYLDETGAFVHQHERLLNELEIAVAEAGIGDPQDRRVTEAGMGFNGRGGGVLQAHQGFVITRGYRGSGQDLDALDAGRIAHLERDRGRSAVPAAVLIDGLHVEDEIRIRPRQETEGISVPSLHIRAPGWVGVQET